MLVKFHGENVVRLEGFEIDDGVIIDNCISIENKIPVYITPSMIRFLVMQNISKLEKMGIRILDIDDERF